MLDYLRRHTELPVPAVLYVCDDLLVLEFVSGDGRFTPESERHAADLLAELHTRSAPSFGFEFDTLIGPLQQPNPRVASWREFFREQRLLHMADVAFEAQRLPLEARRNIDKVASRLDDLLDEPPAPSLVHGDVWTGNVLAEGGCITAFVDPAIYFADSEVELAFITLFGTFGRDFFERYQAVRGVREGFFEVRRDLYNLYPLLTHVRLFGEPYLAQLNRIVGRYAR